MSAIDWDAEFKEPWRSIGKAFLLDLAALSAGGDIIPLSHDRRAMRLTSLTRAEIAAAAGVSERTVSAFAIGEIPSRSPMAERIRAVLDGELVSR